MKLKTIFLMLGLMLCFNFSQVQAQEGTNPSSVNYQVGDLEKLDKLELTKIYIQKVNRLSQIMPYLPFKKLEPKNPADLKIPGTSINEKALSGYEKEIKNYTETSDAALSNLIPYADKKDIMDSIIFMQNFISKIELIGLGMAPIN